jgi:hypothetical protein
MPSPTLEKIRKQFPDLDDISDNELTVRIGNEYPELLEKDNELASEFTDLTEFTVGGAASQVYQKTTKGAPMLLGKIGWGVAEGFTAPILGDYSAADLGVFGLVKTASKFFGNEVDITGAINRYSKSLSDEADNQLRKINEGGLVTSYGGIVSSGFGLLGDATETYYEGTEAEMPTEWERRLGNVAQTTATLVPTIAAAPGGTPAVLAAAGLTTFGSTFQESRRAWEDAGDPDANRKAFATATVDGLKTAAITYTGMKFAQKLGLSDVDKLAGLKGDKVFASGMGNFLKRVGLGAPIEGVEEGIDEALSSAIATVTYNPNADIKEAFAEAFFAGALIGGATGSIEGYSQYSAAKKEARELADKGLPKTADKILLNAQRKWENRNKPDDEIIPLPDDPSQAPDEVVRVDAEGRPTREVKPTVTTTDDLDAENVPEIKTSSNVDAQIEAAEAEANRIAETDEAEVTVEAPTEPEAPTESTREEIEAEWKKSAKEIKSRLQENDDIDDTEILTNEVIDEGAREYADGVLAERAKAATPDPTPAETPVDTPAATTPAAGTQQDLIGEATQDEVDELIDHEFYTELGLTPVTPLADPDSIKSRMTKEQQEYFEEELEEQKQSLGQRYESQSAKDNWNNSGVFERRKDLSRRSTPQPETTAAPQEVAAQPTQEEVVDQQEGTITEEQSESLAAKLTKLAQASNRMKSKGKFLWDERRGGKGNKGASKTNKPKNPDKLEEFENELASIANETGVTVESLREKIKDLVFQRALETKTTGKGKQLNKDRTKAEIEFLKLPEGETDVLDDFIDTVGGKIDVPVGKDKKVIVKGDSKQKLPADYDGIDNFATAVNELSRTQPSVAGDLINRVPASEVKSPIDDYAKTIGVETSQFWDLMADAINRRIELNRIKQEQKSKKPLQEVLTKKDKSKRETQLSEVNEKDTFVVDGITYSVESRSDDDTSTTLVVAPLGSREYTDIVLTDESLLYLEDFQATETNSQGFGGTVVSTSENNSPSSDAPFASVPNEIVNGVRIAKPTNEAQENVLTRVAALIPKIQRKLGGAKLRNIFVSTDNNQPAFSGARGGDFGSVYLNPEVIIELERQGKGDLERILIEEIIHNYNGLALYREWDATGRVDSFQTFYERKMTEVFLEMSKGEIAETSFWYGNQIDGDAVAIAEEFLRIALQRKLTGSINEDLFGRKVQQKGALGKLMDILAKFWNGIKRGSMGNSSRINTLKKRIRLMMNDQRVSFPAIDGARLTFTAAAGSEFVQDEFQLEGEQSPERFVQISHREYEEEVHEENSFDNNTGDFLGALFAKSRLDLKKLNREASLNAKGASTMPAIDAAFIQPQVFETIPLPEEFIVNTYATIHKTLAKDQTLSDTQKDQAMMYVLSRATNDARRFLVKNKRWQDASEALLGGEKGDYSLSSLIRTRLIDYRNMSRSLGQKLVKSGDGLVSLDMPVELTEESTETTVGDLVPNPFTLTPSQELINDELLNYIQEAEVSLTSSEKDLLSFGFQENFKHGWLSAYAKSRGTGRSAAKMQWNKVSDTMALALASKKDLDVQVGREIPPRLVDKIAKVQAAYDILSEQRKEKVSAEEKARIQQNIRKLIDKQTKPAEDVEEQRTGVRSVEVTREGEVIAGDFDITNANIRKQLNLPPLERDSEGRIINEPRDSSVLEEPLPRKRKIVAASLPPEFLEEVSDKAEDITAEEARNYRATDDVKNDDSIDATDSRRDEVKERMDAAAENTSKWYEPYVEFASDLLETAKKLTRQFENLDPSIHGHTVEVLRQFQATTELSQTKARESLRAIVNGLTPEQFDFFTKVLVYRDLQQSIKNGLYQKNKDLPFGFQDASEVDFLLQESEADLLKPENQKVRDAIQRRKAILEDLTKQMQKRKLLPKDITDAENYFHRITIEHRDAVKRGTITAKTDVRTKRAGFQRKREGSEKDYSTDFLEAENEVLAQGYAQIQTHDTLVRLEGMLNQKSQLKAQAKASNEKELAKVVPLGDLETFFKPFNTKIAIGFSQLQKLLNKRQINYAPHFQEVAESLEEGTQHPDTFAFLSHLMETQANGAGYAGMIFKNVKAKESAIENALGNKYETWKTLTQKNPELTTWQPVEGNFLYKGTVASDQALLKWFEEASAGDTTTISKEALRKQLVLGGRRDEWAIPIDVAEQLNELEPDKTPIGLVGKIGNVQSSFLGAWKFWKLFNPPGFIKYELNNLTGDFDVAFAYDPKIVTQYSKQAYQDLYDFHVKKKPLPKDMEELLKKGVLGSGYMLQDLAEMKPEVAVDALFNDFVDGLKKKSSWLKDFTNNYKRKVATINQVREDTLRLAAYRYFQDKLETGSNVFGASKPNELALIPDKKDKAAKMARELLGDYGAISTGGRWLRRKMMPFWSWMEINAPRYVRMMKNAHLEDRTGTKTRVAGAAAKSLAVKGATQTIKFGLLASTFPLFVNMFNRFMIEAGAVDEEDKRVADARNQQHLLLYSTEEGRVISLKMQGAFTDALEWFGLGSMYATATDVAFTEDTLADATEDYLSQGEFWKGSINRVAGSLAPNIKMPLEIIPKQSLFPDATRRTPMRDRTAYFLQNLEMGWATMGVNSLYKLGQNFPSKGVTGSGDIASSLWQFVGYTTDTGESAYSYIKAKEYNFYNEKEGDRGGFTTSDKSDALYYHKKAKKWGDESSAEAWKEKYFELGGTKAGMKRSITSSKPLAKIKKYRSEFLRTLTDYEKEILERAEKWYKETNK